MTDRSAYEQKRQAQLRQLDAEIDKLKAKAAEATADAKIELDRSLEAVRRHRETLRSRLDELADVGEDAWTEVRDGVEAAWKRLRSALDDAGSDVKATDSS